VYVLTRKQKKKRDQLMVGNVLVMDWKEGGARARGGTGVLPGQRRASSSGLSIPVGNEGSGRGEAACRINARDSSKILVSRF